MLVHTMTSNSNYRFEFIVKWLHVLILPIDFSQSIKIVGDGRITLEHRLKHEQKKNTPKNFVKQQQQHNGRLESKITLKNRTE